MYPGAFNMLYPDEYVNETRENYHSGRENMDYVL